MTHAEKTVSLLPGEADALLVTDEVNIRYLCSFPYTDGCLFLTKNALYLITDFRYIEAAKEACPDFRVLSVSPGKGMYRILDEICKSERIKTVLFEDFRLTVRGRENLSESVPGVVFLPAGNLIEKQMRNKTESEFASIRKAQHIAEEALSEMLDSSRLLDMTEKEFAAKLDYLMLCHGSEERAFETIAVSGESSSRPHGVPGNIRLRDGFLTVDFGAKINGFCSDMTRTFCVGNPTEEMQKVYRTVLRAQEIALEAILSGERNCRRIDILARDYIEKSGYSGCFGHGLGHGVGLRIHEAPSLSPRAPEDAMLKPGDVVTVEPGIYLEGRFGVRIEDMVFIG